MRASDRPAEDQPAERRPAEHQPAEHHGMRDVAGIIEPSLKVVSVSKPEPTLQPLNIVAVYRSENDARNAVLALESIEADDAAVGMTVLDVTGNPTLEDQRTPNDDATIRGLDPEGVTGDIGPRAVKGAIVGALVGAILIGGVAALWEGVDAAVAGALGGLLFGAAIGAVWGAFVRMGGSDAYRQSFVDPSTSQLMLVSLHTADSDAAERGRDLMATNADRSPYIVRCGPDGIRLI